MLINTTKNPSQNSFNLMTFRDTSVFEFVDDDGNFHRVQSSERYYVPSEITRLLKSVGFTIVDIYGCKLGVFSRDDVLTIEDFEMLVIAQK
jgi:hypothetical protein